MYLKIPKIKFRAMTLEENIDLIKWAYYEGNGVLSIHDFTIQYFPELANIDDSLSQKEVYKIIENVVRDEYNKCQLTLDAEVKRYNALWEKYNDKYFTTLSSYLGVDWPLNIDVIEGQIGLIPVFPRYLDSFSFSLSIGIDAWKIIETCAHESLHFLWFEKWKVVYPEIPREEYESPYVTWQYSEMVTDPILNNHPFSNMFDFKEKGYDSFYEIYDGDLLVMNVLRNIYSEDIPIEEKITRGFDYIKRML